jgi:hypothetical protein
VVDPLERCFYDDYFCEGPGSIMSFILSKQNAEKRLEREKITGPKEPVKICLKEITQVCIVGIWTTSDFVSYR